MCSWLIAAIRPMIRGSIAPRCRSQISSEFESSTFAQLIGSAVGPGSATA